MSARSSASRGAGTPILNGLDSLRDRAINTCLTLDARGGMGWEKAIWAVPGSLTLVVAEARCRPAHLARLMHEILARPPAVRRPLETGGAKQAAAMIEAELRRRRLLRP